MDDDLEKKDLRRLWGRFRRRDRYTLSWPTRITLMRILLIVPFVGCMLNTHDSRLSAST